ncbi:MAG TPA: pyrroline-5-carboxylate reductase dimerization domain-containing protein [Solirubrobacterales bacterium]|nr:pyrroline-5-carboxylate reductase dimerization domain-containing protein [Solirubrobacterales bacterium]
MTIGFVGAGRIAAALARGWAGEGMLFSDSGSGRARGLAEELGGEALANEEIADRADLVVLAVEPDALTAVAPELGAAQRIVSLLAGIPMVQLRAAFPAAAEIVRALPNVGVEVRRGVICLAGDASPETRKLLDALGRVVEVPEERFEIASTVAGCSPAYLALALEAVADAGADAGLEADLARELVVEAAVGTAELLRSRDFAELRNAVSTPGGSTEAGLLTLDDAGARRAFEAAVAASLERMRR